MPTAGTLFLRFVDVAILRLASGRQISQSHRAVVTAGDNLSIFKRAVNYFTCEKTFVW